MALFFDLSVPFIDSGAAGSSSTSSESKMRKDARLKAVVRAMELGYAGVAYDRPFRGVLSDAERCQIPPFPLSSLLKVAPALAASASFHRDLLGAPLSVPFRQYTRLTVYASGSPAVLSLNGCHVLRTYDMVAVRPLSQDAFDKTCEASEVNIIALDISQKLPFRLKLPLVKLAIQRGLYFEITYSHLIGDVHVRRQILSDVKLLAEWTRGKNLIISSAAADVNEVRGPHDVINLAAYLLGLSAERARACISGNCRALVADALKKKQFHKEAIRVERIAPSEQLDYKKFWIADCNNYDPMSSGAGDLPSLDDISKSFSSVSKPSVHVNSIDFTTLTNGTPFILGQNAAMISSPKKVSQSAAPCDARYVSDDTDQYDIPIRNSSIITLSPLQHKKSSCDDSPVSGSDIPMSLAEAKHSGVVAETDGRFKGFDESALASEAVLFSSPKGYESPCEIPFASNDDTPEVDHCLDPLVMVSLERQKPYCKDFHDSGHVTLITEAQECGVVEIDGNLKTSDQCAFTSDRIKNPSFNATLRACSVLSLNSNPAVTVIENKQVSDIFMEDHEQSHLSSDPQIKISKDITETMECTAIAHDQILPKDGHLSFASLMDKNILEEQIETKVIAQDQKDEMIIADEPVAQVFLHQSNNKGHNVVSSGLDVTEDGFVETKVQEGDVLLSENDPLMEEGVFVLKEDLIKVIEQDQKVEMMVEDEMVEQVFLHQSNNRGYDVVSSGLDVNEDGFVETKVQEGEILFSESDPSLEEGVVVLKEDLIKPPLTIEAASSETKSENKEASDIVEAHEILILPDKSEYENMLPEQEKLEIREQEKKDEHMIDEETLEENNTVMSVQDAIKDGFVETKVQNGQTLLLENDASSKKDMLMSKEDRKMPLITEATPYKTKSGNRSHKGRLLRPAYPLPFKSIFKPMFYRKKLQKSKGPSNMS